MDDLDTMETVLTVDNVDPQIRERRLTEATSERSRQFETITTNAEDDAIIIYTSGTTGDPKGVHHVHRFFLGHLLLFSTGFYNLETTDHVLFWMPSGWAWITVFDIIFPALYYGRPAFAYNEGKFNTEVAFDLIDRCGVTVEFVRPTVLRMMKQVDAPEEQYTLDSVRAIASGGETLNTSTYKWTNITFGDVSVHEVRADACKHARREL